MTATNIWPEKRSFLSGLKKINELIYPEIVYLLQQHLEIRKLKSVKIEDAIKSNFQNEHQKLVVNLMYTGNYFRDIIKDILKPYGLLPQHYNALRIIAGKHPLPSHPGNIKKVLLDKANDVTRLLDKLEDMTFIQRKICESNRRKIDVHISEAGLNLLKSVQGALDELHEVMRNQISGEEAALVNKLIDKIKYNEERK